MDIVLITRDRSQLTEQTVRSMRANAADWSKHRLAVVFDGTVEELRAWVDGQSPLRNAHSALFGGRCHYLGITGTQLGVGGAKNHGARMLGDISGALDHPHEGKPNGDRLLMFTDCDMYYLPRWDRRIERGMYQSEDRGGYITQLGGWRHPFHQLGSRVEKCDPDIGRTYEVDAVTGNCFVMRWADWLRYGPFDANAIGPGQSEDFALSQRIKQAGGIVATLDPPVAIHCGMVNSIGEPAVGWRDMEAMITKQLAAMTKEQRNDVLIMRPAPFAGVHQVPATGAGRTQLVEPDGRVEMEIDYRKLPPAGEQAVRDWMKRNKPTVDRAFEDARAELGMQPRTAELLCAECGKPVMPFHNYVSFEGSEPDHAFQIPQGRTADGGFVGARTTVRASDGEPFCLYRDGSTDREIIVEQTQEDARDVIPGPIAPVGLRREASTDEVRERYPHWHGEAPFRYVRNAPLIQQTYSKFLGVEDTRPLGLNVGSGQRRFESTREVRWINIDAQQVPPDRMPDVVCNVGVERLPMPDGSVQYVVLHQVLEHFGCGEATAMLAECWRVLAPGGSLIVTVPDMRALVGRWLGGELDTQLYMTNVYGAYMGAEEDRHKWGFDAGSLRSYLLATLPGSRPDYEYCAENYTEREHEIGACQCRKVKPFDWREIPGALIARDWWVLGAEVVKP